jgi:hypothetical protein
VEQKSGAKKGYAKRRAKLLIYFFHFSYEILEWSKKVMQSKEPNY